MRDVSPHMAAFAWLALTLALLSVVQSASAADCVLSDGTFPLPFRIAGQTDRSTVFMTVKYCDCDLSLASAPSSDARVEVVRKAVAAIGNGRFEDFAALARSATRTDDQIRVDFKLWTDVFQKDKPARIVSRYDIGSVSYFGLDSGPGARRRVAMLIARDGDRYVHAPQLLQNGILQNIAALDRARAESPERFPVIHSVVFSSQQQLLPKALVTGENGAKGPSVTIQYAMVKCDTDLLQATDDDLTSFGAAAPALQFYRRAYHELKQGDPKRFIDALSPAERADGEQWLARIEAGPGGLEDFRRTILTQQRVRAVIDAGSAWIIVVQHGPGSYGAPIGAGDVEFETVRWNEGRRQFEIVDRVNTANMESLLRDPAFRDGLGRQVAFAVDH